MTQEERRSQMRERIIAAACHEFGSRSYEAASVNRICQQGEFSKGVLYHYYSSQDALFLGCVDHSFQKMTRYCREHLPDSVPVSRETVRYYFQCRHDFFLAYPDLQGVVSLALTNPPAHLAEEVTRLKQPFDQLNYQLLDGYLNVQKKVAGIPLADMLALMEFYQSYCNSCSQMREAAAQGIEACEELRKTYLDAFLHGVIRDSDSSAQPAD